MVKKLAPATALNVAATVGLMLIIALDQSGVMPNLLAQFGFAEGPVGIVLLALWGSLVQYAIGKQVKAKVAAKTNAAD